MTHFFFEGAKGGANVPPGGPANPTGGANCIFFGFTSSAPPFFSSSCMFFVVADFFRDDLFAVYSPSLPLPDLGFVLFIMLFIDLLS